MQSVYILVYTLAVALSARAREFKSNNSGNRVRMVRTSYGQYGHERVDVLFAQIHPRHVTMRQRLNFPSSGPLSDYFVIARAPGDERGHLVGSQFSGPVTWYNLSPQNARVNRNRGYQSITTYWYGTECEVRRFLDQGGNRYVNWLVEMTYILDSNRPHEYHLTVDFIENGQSTGRGIDTRIHNPFRSEDSRFWVCRQCRSSDHGSNDHDELRK